VRYRPWARRLPDRYSEIEGAPDLVVEVLSDASESKDNERLPRLYARAGIPELWLVDARGGEPRFEVHTLSGDRYERVAADPAGTVRSLVLGLAVRLVRQRTRLGGWRYALEHSEA
ncbi:MAG TPA: Uma2 family endonuclease, partial [Thermoanaerobaculia bacterium]